MNSKIEAWRAIESTTRQSPYVYGSRLPKETQEVVAEHLRAGGTISGTARQLGLSREQVRTIRYAMFGLTLAEARALKRRLKV